MSLIEIEFDPTTRWETKAPEYASKERRCTISLLALGILTAWGVVAGSVVMTLSGDSEISTMGIILTSVAAFTALFVTYGLYQWGKNLKTNNPIRYDADNPRMLKQICNELSQQPLKNIAENYHKNTHHLAGSGIVTEETAEMIQTFVSRYLDHSHKKGRFHATYSDNEIHENNDILGKLAKLTHKYETLTQEWKLFQMELMEQLPNSLDPCEAIEYTEISPLLDVVHC